MAVKSPFTTGASAADRETDARNLWDQSGQWATNDRSRAETDRASASGAASTALDKYSSGPTGVNARAFTPTVPGYSPTQMQQWMASMASLPMPSLARSGGGGGGGAGGTAVLGGAGGGGGELAKFSARDLTDFDPTEAGTTYARGAMGMFKTDLGDMLTDYEDQSVAAGRLRTGEYDRSRGKIITRATSDFEDRLAQAALTFSGQKLSALQSGTGMNLERATAMDANARALQELNANLGFEREKLDSSNSLALEEAMQSRMRMGMQGAQYIDSSLWDRSVTGDKMGWERATFLDTADENRQRTALDARLTRERTFMDEYDRSANRAADFASANRDWAARDRDAEELRAAIDKLSGNSWGGARVGGGAGTASSPVDEVNQKVAASMGVPYRRY